MVVAYGLSMRSDIRLGNRGSICWFSAYGKTRDNHTNLVKPVTERHYHGHLFLRFHKDTMKLEIRLLRARRLAGKKGRVRGAVFNVQYILPWKSPYGTQCHGNRGGTDPADCFLSSLPSSSL